MLKEKEVVMKQYNDAEAIREDVESDLAAAQPEMDKAKQAVNAIDKNSIVEMGALQKPSEAIRIVMEPIMILMDKPKNWDSAKKEMKGSEQFLQKLRTFDVTTVPEAKLRKVRNDYIA